MEKFKIKTEEPTKEQLEANSKRWYAPMTGLNMDEWNKGLQEVSFPYHILKVPPQLCIDAINGIDKQEDFKNIFQPFIDRLGYSEYFLKAITRSPKDYLDGEPNGMKMSSYKEAYKALFCSMRTAEDLCMLSVLDKCEIVVRPFIEINPMYEFRVFVYGKKIVGITQYFYDKTFAYGEKREIIEIQIQSFVKTEIIPNVPKNHFVVDVIFGSECKMIELNPFGLSDPCLFYSYENLDGSFKIKE